MDFRITWDAECLEAKVAMLVKYMAREITWAAVETAATVEPPDSVGEPKHCSGASWQQWRRRDLDARCEEAVAAALKAIATYRAKSNAEPLELAKALRLSAVVLESIEDNTHE